MGKALLTGSFDPPTLGHLDLIERASHLFDNLIVGLTENLAKKKSSLLTISKRQELLETITRHLPNVEVLSYSGLTVDFAKQQNITYMIRGIRNGQDFDAELALSLANRKLKEIETLLLPANPNTLHISSSLIREIASAKGSLKEFLPAAVIEEVRKAFA